jgi:chemotaxis response regulator CheB
MVMRKIRVLVFDDSLTIRAMIEQLASKESFINIVGICSDGSHCGRKIEDLRPDVVTLDLNMPGLDGIALLDAMQAYPHPPVVVLSSATKPDNGATRHAIDHGATACFDKSILVSQAPEFFKLLRQVTQQSRSAKAA